MSRWALLLLVVLLLAAPPAAAQDSAFQAAALVPADFAGFIRLRTDEPGLTLNSLNAMLALTGELQPARVQLTEALNFEAFIPFNSLFDVEAVAFVDHVLPWLGDEIVLAYRQFDAALQAGSDDVLLILPTDDMFEAASRLRPVIEGQDLLQRETYRDTTLYIGDKTTIAVALPAVLVGADTLVRQALDVQAGEAEALAGTAVFQAVRAASPADTMVFAYVAGDYLPQAVAGVLSGSAAAQPLFPALGAAVASLRGTPGPDTRLLNGEFDGAAVSLRFVPDEPKFEASAVFYSGEALEPAAAPDAALLDYVPRTVLMAQRGDSLKDLAYTVLAALPASSFSGRMLGGLPFNTAGGATPLIGIPAAADLQTAAASFFDGLRTAAGLDLQADLLDRMTASYVVALLPRPNDPLPVLRLPFDTLLVTPVSGEEGGAVTQTVSRLLQTVFAVQPLDEAGDSPFTRLGSGTEVVFEFGVVDGVLILGTGSAARQALDARQGDNRLIEQAAWQALSEPDAPILYMDAAVLFNTLFPVAGGTVPAQNQRVRAGLWSARPERHLWQLKLVATLPTGQ